jgi:adenosylmethionine-8-amino-7-oxononanoate aminotransferase
MSRTRELRARDQRALWHPFTQMSDWMDGNPVVIERGEGNYLIDTDGNRYLDGVSSLWVNLHGHDHPILRARIHAQLDKLAHSTLLGLSGVPSIELAEKLVAIAPP